MKTLINDYNKNQNIGTLISLFFYSILLLPMLIIYSFTWFLSPIEPENLSDLEKDIIY